jgi:hypothetical protein
MRKAIMKQSQSGSFDIMIAIVIFIGTIFVFYSAFSNNPESNIKDLESEASIVLENIASEDPVVGLIEDTEISEEKIQQLLGEDYELIKEQVRVKNDFCIFLEDQDGKVVYLSQGTPGIGSDKIKIGANEESCG